MATYRYQPLEPGAIRLLEFSSLRDEELTFKMRDAQSKWQKKSFAALSYRWGLPDSSQRIRIDNAYLRISTTLRDALLQVKRHFKESSDSPKLLWVDAICLNQSDNNEKSDLVCMMYDIYNTAHRVIVWLGLPLNDRNMGLAVAHSEFLRDFAMKAQYQNFGYRFFWQKRDGQDQREHRALSSAIYKKIDRIYGVEGSDTRAAWQGIVEIIQNPWWRRAWIVQESTVKEPSKTLYYMGRPIREPQPKVYFMCGPHITFWRQLDSSWAIATILQASSSVETSTSLPPGTFAAGVFMSQTRHFRLSGQEPPLLDQLQLARPAEATDPRDKVYANLGMIPKAVAALIRPDYNKSVVDVYLDVVRIELEHNNPSLEFLGYTMKVDAPSRPPSPGISFDHWPSWIPNWDDPLNFRPLAKKLYNYSRNVSDDTVKVGVRHWMNDDLICTGNVYNASRTAPVQALVVDRELHIAGALLDTVLEVYSLDETSEEAKTRLAGWYGKQSYRCPNLEAFDDILLRVQVADVQLDAHGRAMTRGFTVDNELLQKDPAKLEAKTLSAQTLMQRSMHIAGSHRMLVLTRRGYIGLAPQTAKPGDWICMLQGGQVIYVLRPSRSNSQCHEYVGEAFVHGLMDGEAWDSVQEGNSVIQEFVLV